MNDVSGVEGTKDKSINPSHRIRTFVYMLVPDLCVVKINRYSDRSTEMIGEVIPRFLYIADTAVAYTSIYRTCLPPRRGFADNYRNNNNNNLRQK